MSLYLFIWHSYERIYKKKKKCQFWFKIVMVLLCSLILFNWRTVINTEQLRRFKEVCWQSIQGKWITPLIHVLERRKERRGIKRHLNPSLSFPHHTYFLPSLILEKEGNSNLNYFTVMWNCTSFNFPLFCEKNNVKYFLCVA